VVLLVEGEAAGMGAGASGAAARAGDAFAAGTPGEGRIWAWAV
jgi:hypothetical protein